MAKFKEKAYEQLATYSKSKPKSWWSSVKLLLGRSRDSSLPTIVHKGKYCLTDIEKAEAFNETNLESCNLIDENVELPSLPIPTHDLLENIIIAENDVNEILLGLDTTKSWQVDFDMTL